jgi:hypothetical protein
VRRHPDQDCRADEGGEGERSVPDRQAGHRLSLGFAGTDQVAEDRKKPVGECDFTQQRRLQTVLTGASERTWANADRDS